MTPFTAAPGGVVRAQFSNYESQLICDLAGQLTQLLSETVPSSDDHLLAIVGIGGGESLSADPAIARLLPDAYADDAEASVEFRRLTEHSLADRKLANARLVTAGLIAAQAEEFELDAAAQQAWLRTITDIRLVLASRLGIETDDDTGRGDSDEERMMRDVYDWLAAVQTTLLDAMEP